jgi:NIMA (never in mitosis gene a)-related kinase
MELLPKPVEALRGVRMGSIATSGCRCYAVASTGEMWAWGSDTRCAGNAPLGHGEMISCPVPKPIESLRGIKVDAVAASYRHTLALADGGSVYAWGSKQAAMDGALGLGDATRNMPYPVRKPQRIPELRVACGL